MRVAAGQAANAWVTERVASAMGGSFDVLAIAPYFAPTDEQRDAHGHPTWMYWFTWASPAFGGILGSAHALDIPFAFDNLHAPGAAMLLGDDTDGQRLATRFADEITGFALNGFTSWPAFDPSARATLRLDATVELLSDPESGIRSWWEQSTTV